MKIVHDACTIHTSATRLERVVEIADSFARKRQFLYADEAWAACVVRELVNHQRLG